MLQQTFRETAEMEGSNSVYPGHPSSLGGVRHIHVPHLSGEVRGLLQIQLNRFISRCSISSSGALPSRETMAMLPFGQGTMMPV